MLRKIKITKQDELVMERTGKKVKTKDGSTWQGFVPLADDDYRYFERRTDVKGIVTWFELS